MHTGSELVKFKNFNSQSRLGSENHDKFFTNLVKDISKTSSDIFEDDIDIEDVDVIPEDDLSINNPDTSVDRYNSFTSSILNFNDFTDL